METTLSRRGFVTGSLVAAGAAGMAAGIPSAQADTDFAASLKTWLQDRSNYAAANSDFEGPGAPWAYLPGEENAPTDEELVEMFRIANSYQVCHALGAAHFVVVRDPEEQNAILNSMGVSGSGTVTVLLLADGCKDRDHRSVPYSELRSDPVHYWDMYYALIELGEAATLLNLAARSMGYRIHNFGAVDIPNISYENGLGAQEVPPIWGCGGSWDMIRDENWDIAKYCHSKDGSVDFTHYVYANDQHVPLDGNLTMVYAMTIGTVDEDALDTSVTAFNEGTDSAPFNPWPQDMIQGSYNFSFWDTGVDGISLYEPTPAWTEAYAAWEASGDTTEAGEKWSASADKLAS